MPQAEQKSVISGEPKSSHGLVDRLVKLVPVEEWRRFLEDSLEAWRGLSGKTKLFVLLIVVAVTVVALCVYISRFLWSGSELGLLSRLWDGGFLLALATLLLRVLIAFVKRPATVVMATGEVAVVPIILDDGTGVLGLNKRQCLALLVCLVIPVMLIGVLLPLLAGGAAFSFVGVLAGLLLGGIVLASIFWCGEYADLRRWGIILGVASLLPLPFWLVGPSLYPVVLVIVTIVPLLQLLTLARRGMPPIRVTWSLMTVIVVWGLAIFVGITVMPRSVGLSDESVKLVGTWTKDRKTATFTANKTVSIGGGYSEWVARYKFDGTTLTIFDDVHHRKGTLYHVDLASDSSMLLGEVDDRDWAFGEFSVMKGRWDKVGKSEADSAPKGPLKKSDFGPKDPTTTQPPKLDSPLAAKLVGNWQGLPGKTIGQTVQFTKSGKVEFNYPDLPRKEETKTVLGTYSFKKDALLRLDEAGSSSYDDGWQVDVEFLNDDEILFVNHGSRYSGFGPLAGRYKRTKP